MSPWLTIIGVGVDGIEGLAPPSRAALAAAHTVIGAERLLAGAPAAAERIAWRGPLAPMVETICARRGAATALLASGDPLWFGIAASLGAHVAAGEMAVLPAPSAFQLAAARLRWPLQHVATISLHGRPVELLHPHVLPGNRVLALTADRRTLAAAADLLVGRGYGDSVLTVLERLGATDERIGSTPARVLQAGDYGDFHVLAIDCAAAAGAPLLPPLPGLPDEAFVSDGQLSKREVRAATLARLAPFPGALLWDVGAGCGSIAIEWLRGARDARAIAFERQAARRDMIAANARALGVPHLGMVGGAAPSSLAGQPPPDAVFIGGGVEDAALFAACWAALRPGGRLVANAVTLGGQRALLERQARFGGELVRIEVEVLDRIGGQAVLRPRLPVLQWAAGKP